MTGVSNFSSSGLATRSTAAPTVDPEILVLRLVYLIASRYAALPVIAAGLFGNALSVLITLQKDNRRISTCNYMTALALADSVVLIVEFEWAIFQNIWTDNPPSELQMQLIWYLGFAFAILSGFYLAEMTVDRLIVVRFPMSAPILCTTRRTLITIVITFFAICGLNVYVLTNYKYVHDEHTGTGILRMEVEGPLKAELEALGYAAQLAIGTILPFVVIVFCNLWIFYTLRQASKDRVQMGISAQDQKSREKEKSYLTKMLILVSIAYVLTSIPYRLYEVIMGIPEVTSAYNMKEEYWSLRVNCTHFILLTIWDMNYAVNFYMYCIGGGKKYRNDVKQRLKSLFCCRHEQ